MVETGRGTSGSLYLVNGSSIYRSSISGALTAAARGGERPDWQLVLVSVEFGARRRPHDGSCHHHYSWVRSINLGLRNRLLIEVSKTARYSYLSMPSLSTVISENSRVAMQGAG
jgi:hypothetical protein